MPEASVSPEAQTQLDAIYDYVADRDPEAARRMSRRFDEVFLLLANTPNLGRDRSRLLPGARSFAVGNYVVFYSPIAGGIEVHRVLYGGRDLERAARE